MQTNQKILTKVGGIVFPTRFGNFRLSAFQNTTSGKYAIALQMGELKDGENVLVRVHSSCLTGDVLGSVLCDCGSQLEEALQLISRVGRGLLIYLDQEGRGIGLGNKILAMELQEQGLDTVEANLALGLPVDARTFEEAAEIIKTIGIKTVCLITNNPKKVVDLENLGIEVADRVACVSVPAFVTEKYLRTKKERMGHLLPM